MLLTPIKNNINEYDWEVKRDIWYTVGEAFPQSYKWLDKLIVLPQGTYEIKIVADKSKEGNKEIQNDEIKNKIFNHMAIQLEKYDNRCEWHKKDLLLPDLGFRINLVKKRV